jgi:hypothetical protein
MRLLRFQIFHLQDLYILGRLRTVGHAGSGEGFLFRGFFAGVFRRMLRVSARALFTAPAEISAFRAISPVTAMVSPPAFSPTIPTIAILEPALVLAAALAARLFVVVLRISIAHG